MSRALRRHHRERVIANRVREATIYLGAEEVRRSPRRWPAGALADDQRWIGCGGARCVLCHAGKLLYRTADRMRAEREWRRDWGV